METQIRCFWVIETTRLKAIKGALTAGTRMLGELRVQLLRFWRSISLQGEPGGTKPSYLGVQKSSQSLALCPATNNCVSTSEEMSDANHYAPPWNYNPKDGPRKRTISKDEAMEELLKVITSMKPDNFTPIVVERKGDYIRVPYWGLLTMSNSGFLPARNLLLNIDLHHGWGVSISIPTENESRHSDKNSRKRVGLLRAISSPRCHVVFLSHKVSRK